MSYLILDVETTTFNKGNPFDERNKLCYVGLKADEPFDRNLYDIEYSDTPFRRELEEIQAAINSTTTLVGFNIKFDLHWIRNYGITFTELRIWDCQLMHFIITGQSHTYPSLNEVAEYYGLGSKLDVVSEVYWKNGVDTKDIPKEILEEYLQGDLDLTEQVYLKQLEYLKQNPKLARLCSLHNQDVLVLEEMEYNGLLYDYEKSKELAAKTRIEIAELDSILYSYHNLSEFNPNSTDQLSAFLYGGSIKLKRREVIGTFKTGARAGQPKERWVEYFVEFPRLVRPLKGSELTKENLFSTDEPTLRSLKGSKKAMEVIEILLKRAELDKRVSTYYEGLNNLCEEMYWKKGVIHGQLNQCVVKTGRLSSSRPNLQNFDGKIKELFYTRFA